MESGLGGKPPGLQQRGPQRGLGVVREASTLLRFTVGGDRARVGPRPQAWGWFPRGQPEGSPAEAGWARSLGKACAPLPGAPSKAGSQQTGPFLFIVRSPGCCLVFGLSLTSV